MTVTVRALSEQIRVMCQSLEFGHELCSEGAVPVLS